MILPDASPTTVQKRVISGNYRVDPRRVAARMIERGNEALDGLVVGRKAEHCSALGKKYGGVFLP